MADTDIQAQTHLHTHTHTQNSDSTHLTCVTEQFETTGEKRGNFHILK